MPVARKSDIAADRAAEVEMFYVIVSKTKKAYFSRDEDWSQDYATAMRFPTSNDAEFEMRGVANPHDYVSVVGPCIEGEEP